MKILRTYCLKELLTPFFLSLSLFGFIFIVGNLVKLADLLVNRGVSIFDIIKILILLIPDLIGFILPTAALAAVLLVFGGFAQNNEITAMKASGVNIFRVMIPIMTIALMLSIGALFLIDQVQPRAKFASRMIINDMLTKKPTAYIESGRFIKDFKGYILRVRSVKGNQLEGVTIFQMRDGGPTRTIMAERGELVASNDNEHNTVGLQLYNGTSDEPNPDDPTVVYKLNFDTFFLPAINVTESSSQKAKKKVKEMTLDELIIILRNMRQFKQDLIDEGKSEKDIRHDVQELTLRAKAEVHKKIAFSLATFCFVMIGLPLAIVTRRGEAVVSFSLSMAVVAIYYILFIWGGTLAVNGYLPAVIALWIPNVLAIAVSVFFMAKVVRL